MKTPLLLLMLTNRKSGPSFLRAVLSVLHENKKCVPGDVCLINDVGERWGTYVYEDTTDWKRDEKLWYDVVFASDDTIDNLIHF